MRHAVTDLGAFGVVEPIHRADKVAGNPADTLELDALADNQLAVAPCDGHMVNQFHFPSFRVTVTSSDTDRPFVSW